ncbi:hypothetical protein SAMN05518872_109171 [Psychrobacillus sp. OK032]|nr:hypothetical protein SAMN05518872_109171 [Psychrobacillus sp. OK032]
MDPPIQSRKRVEVSPKYDHDIWTYTNKSATLVSYPDRNPELIP